MKLVIAANEQLKEELLSGSPLAEVELIWLNKSEAFSNHREADAVIDLLFEEEQTDSDFLKEFLPRPVIINSVINELSDTNPGFIRINGWPGFLKREMAECSCRNEKLKPNAEKIFTSLGKKTIWVPDVAGFITPRIIIQIINEAYLALEEKVSTKEDIDLAMKLGTHYPYGPFEWAKKIGLKKILDLLTVLSEKENRYQPAPLLIKEAKEKNNGTDFKY